MKDFSKKTLLARRAGVLVNILLMGSVLSVLSGKEAYAATTGGPSNDPGPIIERTDGENCGYPEDCSDIPCSAVRSGAIQNPDGSITYTYNAIKTSGYGAWFMECGGQIQEGDHCCTKAETCGFLDLYEDVDMPPGFTGPGLQPSAACDDPSKQTLHMPKPWYTCFYGTADCQ